MEKKEQITLENISGKELLNVDWEERFYRISLDSEEKRQKMKKKLLIGKRVYIDQQ